MWAVGSAPITVTLNRLGRILEADVPAGALADRDGKGTAASESRCTDTGLDPFGIWSR
jgi:hypothetical protein